MTDKKNMTEKLLEHPGLQSLQMEREIAEMIRLLRWRVVQSSYYVDTETGKHREIDAWCAQAWGDEGTPLQVHIRLLVECKSFEGQTIAFSTSGEIHPEIGPFSLWTGYEIESEPAAQFEKFRSSTARTPAYALMVLDAMRNMCGAGNQRLVNLAQFQLPIVDFIGLGARPIKPVRKDSKSDDNPAIWNTIQSLMSAYKAENQLFRRRHVDATFPALSAFDSSSDIDLIEEKMTITLAAFRESLRYLYLYHPIIVTKAPLKVWNGIELSPAKSVRCPIRGGGDLLFWLDFVNFDYAGEYFRSITDHYAIEMDKVLRKSYWQPEIPKLPSIRSFWDKRPPSEQL